jgi:hypothetical protein
VGQVMGEERERAGQVQSLLTSRQWVTSMRLCSPDSEFLLHGGDVVVHEQEGGEQGGLSQ